MPFPRVNRGQPQQQKAGRFLSRCAALALCLLTATPVLAASRIVLPVDDTQRTELKGHLHPALRNATDLGDADATVPAQRLTLILRASPAQEAALEKFLRDLQTPGSADYQRWITPAEFATRYGVAPADIAVIGTWLRSRGFRIDELPAGGRSIVFSGTIGQVNRAFGAQIRRFDVRGERHIANARNPTIPTAFAGLVHGVLSLHDFRHQPQLVRGAVVPDFNIGGVNYLAPSDFAVIYDLATPYAQGLNGTGRTIAVLGRTSVVAADLSTFRSTFGLAANAPTIINNGAAPGLVAGDQIESDLDLEWTGGVAPAATIKFVTSASTNLADGIDLSAQYAVSNNVADIISLSYGSCEAATDVSAGTTFYNQLWQQAAAQGMSVFVSSGDSGAAGCDASQSSTAVLGYGINHLCSSPYSTCVGGTQFDADVGNQSTYWSAVANSSGSAASALSYIGEKVWNQSALVAGGSGLYASGGGASMYFAKPAWQYATGVPADGRRDVPDVSLNASSMHDGYLIYSSDISPPVTTRFSSGGTSASTPALAGIVALAAQKQGKRLGNINPVLYGLSNAQASGGAAVFHRIISGDNFVPGQAGVTASTADPSYNLATGLGSVDGALLIGHIGDIVPANSSLVPASVLVPPTAFLGTATLTVPAATAWSATVSSGARSWLAVTPVSGTGPASLTFSVAANPATASRSGTISANGMILTLTQAANAGASGNSAQTLVSPGSLAFGTVSVGLASASQRVLVGNPGNAALTLGAIALSGSQPGDFSVSGNCATGAALATGASCYVDVVFHPGATGARSASLQIASSASANANLVSLAGTGGPALASSGAIDVPLPPWAFALLALSLMGVGAAARRRR
jgi:subtilase family serine protease